MGSFSDARVAYANAARLSVALGIGKRSVRVHVLRATAPAFVSLFLLSCGIAAANGGVRNASGTLNSTILRVIPAGAFADIRTRDTLHTGTRFFFKALETTSSSVRDFRSSAEVADRLSSLRLRARIHMERPLQWIQMLMEGLIHLRVITGATAITQEPEDDLGCRQAQV
jgi:hypothetical protein